MEIKTISIEELEDKIKELEKSAQFFQQIADNTFDWEVFRDRKGKIIYLNRAFERITGYTIENLLSGEIREDDFIHPDDKGIVNFYLDRSMQAETVEDLDFRIIRKDGTIRFVNLYSAPVHINNEFTGTRTSIRDVTHHREADDFIKQNITGKDYLEERLTHSHRLMKYIIENDRSAIAVLDNNLSYIYVSRQFINDYKVKERDILGKNHYEVFPDLPDAWREVHRRSLAGEVLSADEDPYEKADGTIEWVRWESRPWFEIDNSIGGIILYTEVITRQKETELELIREKVKAEESESYKTDIMNKLNEAQHIAKIGSWEWTHKTGKVWWSDELYNIFEVIPSEYTPSLESNIKFIHPEDYAVFNEESLKAIKEGRDLDYQLRIITRSGILKHCKTTIKVSLGKDGNPVRLSGTFIDITPQVLIQNELIQAKNKAEESDSLKTAFLHNMSHEIRTPLNSIVGFSQLIAQPGQSQNDLKTYSGIIAENSDKLIGIITDVIEIARIHSSQVKLITSRFNIIQLITRIMPGFVGRAERKNISLSLKNNIAPEDSLIISDKAKLEKIFIHLIDNALKFTQKGFIEVTCEMNSGNLVFMVKDTGIGIAEDQNKMIFEPFRQIESGLSRQFGGNGLGLTIVKAYTELLRGKISLNSELNTGTEISITLPVGILNKEQAATIEKSDTDGSMRPGQAVNTILIAEDEYSNYRYLYEILHSDTVEILHANNGLEAVEMCKERKSISMILMDIKMPVMDGASATKQIKEFRPGLPVIAQTAYVQESEKNDYMDVFDDLITKPIDQNDLRQKIKKYINI
ncbi:MAG: PAS domain S-box protein [Methanococcaceae archaeon]